MFGRYSGQLSAMVLGLNPLQKWPHLKYCAANQQVSKADFRN